MSDEPNRLDLVFSQSIERRRAAAGSLDRREDLYAFVSRLRGEGIPVEATAAVLEFDPMDYRRWAAGDTPSPLHRPPEATPYPEPRTPSAHPVRAGGRSTPPPREDLRGAFEVQVRHRAAELFPEPPGHEEGWYPLVRLLAGEGVPVDVSTAILRVDPAAYRLWLTDCRRQITSAADDSGKPT